MVTTFSALFPEWVVSTSREWALSISQVTGATSLERTREVEIGWPLPEGIEERHLESLLDPNPKPFPLPGREMVDFATIHLELRRKGTGGESL